MSKHATACRGNMEAAEKEVARLRLRLASLPLGSEQVPETRRLVGKALCEQLHWKQRLAQCEAEERAGVRHWSEEKGDDVDADEPF